MEKSKAALLSVFSAILLTVLKFIVGIATNSLGIISEAIHSLIDLGAALLTLFAVKVSDVPADDTHHYGHGKIESISAFVEVIMLLATCIYIINEAVLRLKGKPADIDVNIYAFGVMFISIIVDVTRSKALYKTAKKTNSRALEADALHFASDIWSSLVVIVGLIGVKFLGFEQADAIAGLIVSIFVIVCSVRLSIKTINELMDKAPKKLRNDIYRIIKSVPNVSSVQKLRIRTSGNTIFTDMALLVESSLSVEKAHDIANNVEKNIKDAFPQADITLHLEPKGDSTTKSLNAKEKVEKILHEHRSMFDSYHGLSVMCHDMHHIISVHLELDRNATVRETHAICLHLEEDIKDAIPKSKITIHVEPSKKK